MNKCISIVADVVNTDAGGSRVSTIISPRSREEKNTVFAVLSSHRRRYMLHALQNAGGEATLGNLAEQVAAWEYGKSVDEITSVERKRVYTSLQQHHLEKLESAGLIEVEHDRITTTERGDNMRVYLEVVSEENIPWSLYYLMLSIIGGFSLLIMYLGWFPESWLVGISALFVVVLLISATVHLLENRQMRFGSSTAPPDAEAPRTE